MAAIPRGRQVSKTAPPTPAKSRGRQMSRSTSGQRSMSVSANPRYVGPGSRLRGSGSRGRSKVASYTGPGKSGGFLAKTRYSKKTMKLNKAVLRDGICYVREHAHAVTGSEMLVVGHATCPEAYFARAFALAIVKMVFKMHHWLCGGTMTNTLISNNGYIAGDKFAIGIVDKELSTGGTITFTDIFTVVGGTVSPSTVNDLVDTLTTNILLTYNTSSACYGGIRFIPAAGSFKDRLDINLQGAKLYLKSKSTLKLQNQSVATTGDTEDAVNSVPIFGRYYETTGTSLLPRKQINQVTGAGTQWTANRTNGSLFIAYARDSVAGDYREPPQPSFFSGVKASGKDKLDSGEVKTSILTSEHFENVDRLHKFVSQGSNTLSATAAGKMRCFAFERMIDTGGALADMRIAFENDTKVYAYLKLSNQDYWSQVVDTRVYG